MKKFFSVAACCLSAFLLWSVYPPRDEIAGLAVALVPLLLVSRLFSIRRAAVLWFAGGFLFWFATLAWMPAICKNNGPWPLVVLGWAGLSALCAGYFALFGALDALLWTRVARVGSDCCQTSPLRVCLLRLAALSVAEPVLWAGIEWLRATLFTGFAWNFLGTAVGRIPVFASPARLGGVYLVSALVVLVNGVFATLGERVFLRMARIPLTCGRTARIFRSLETAVPLLLVFLTVRISSVPLNEQTVPIRVALVQRNAPCVFAARTAEREEPLAVYIRLMAAASTAKPDLAVWSESAMSEFGTVDSAAARRAVLSVMRKTGCTALLSGGDAVVREDGVRKVYNAAALYTVTTNDLVPAIYGKQHLVPFGEYIPFDKQIPWLQRFSPVGVSIWPGRSKVLPLVTEKGTVQLGPLICYEDTDPRLARAAALRGAQMIVLITNDSWFSHSAEPVQHAAQAVLRAIETGLPVIRVGNSGVTGVISPDGRTDWLSGEDGRPAVDTAGCQVATVRVPVAPGKTVYTRLGDLPLLVLFVLVVSALVPYRRRGV